MGAGREGDFMGFYFNGHHSSEFGITRVSVSDRQNDNILPTMNDTTVQIPGGDGTYFFGTDFTQRDFQIEFAFDCISEKQLRHMRRWLGTKRPQKFVYDELPYKMWKVNVTGEATLKYICFNEEESWGDFPNKQINNETSTYHPAIIDDATELPNLHGQQSATARGRVYKGEGSLTLTAYDPYAHCPNEFKYLDTYTLTGVLSGLEQEVEPTGEVILNDDNDNFLIDARGHIPPPWCPVDNIDEWSESSGLLYSNDDGYYDNFSEFIIDDVSYYGFKLHNGGDVNAHFILNLANFPGAVTLAYRQRTDVYIDEQRYDGWGPFVATDVLNFNSGCALKGDDVAIEISSKLNLIYGIDSNGEMTGNIYNECVANGHFFTIPSVYEDEDKEYYILLTYTDGMTTDPLFITSYTTGYLDYSILENVQIMIDGAATDVNEFASEDNELVNDTIYAMIHSYTGPSIRYDLLYI